MKEILTPEASQFITQLHRRFNSEREKLLKLRIQRQSELDQGKLPHFSEETKEIREDKTWKVAPVPKDLECRTVEITGPVEAKMMINALNSSAQVFMADFEDALSPTWENILQGQLNLKKAVKQELTYSDPQGKKYALKEKIATLLVRPRGWHLVEKHFWVDGKPISASLFDFGLYFFHNVKERLNRGTAPYFYLPKIESHLEARLWNDVFNFAQDELHISRKTIRATVLIETILAAFEMEEILYELRDHICGLNAGRWDYIFSIIKKFHKNKLMVLPDRVQVTMTVPFMRAYTDLLVKTCHKRGAHAMGGMAAFVPSRKDPQINEVAFQKVRQDKEREAKDGFDGTWVAHPDLVKVAFDVFETHLKKKPHQKEKLREEVCVTEKDLLNLHVPQGKITEAGIRNNISVSLQYVNYWLQGTGAAAIYNLMEDAATAEISRAQLWQWVYHEASLDDGRKLNGTLYKALRDAELEKLIHKVSHPEARSAEGSHCYKEVVEILDGLVLSENFAEFLTVPAYSYLS